MDGASSVSLRRMQTGGSKVTVPSRRMQTAAYPVADTMHSAAERRSYCRMSRRRRTIGEDLYIS